jgi:AcrR family transcriptional regulator
VAEQEIIDAAEALLHERPFRELTVDEVMRRTELSRPSFYVYFRDRHQLVLRVVEQIGGELFTMADRWFEGEGDGPELARSATEGIVAVFAEHGPVLRALADAAADDPDVESAYLGLVNSFRDLISKKIGEEMEAGRVDPATNASEVATALIWAAERYLYLSFAPGSSTASSTVAETLCAVFTRTIYSIR